MHNFWDINVCIMMDVEQRSASDVLLCKYVFGRPRPLKDLSADAVDTGMVRSIFKR